MQLTGNKEFGIESTVQNTNDKSDNAQLPVWRHRPEEEAGKSDPKSDSNFTQDKEKEDELETVLKDLENDLSKVQSTGSLD